MSKKVVLGLSGGMDSAYVAIKLLEDGYDVRAVNVLMCDSCDCSKQSAVLASHLGIKFDVVDARTDFDKLVIKPFVSAYVSGVTPNPCVLCNPLIKFGKLFECMEKFGADYVATGHYAVPVNLGNRWSFAPAIDATKDQGYFLYGLPQWMLPRLVLPLGNVLKSNIREYFTSKDVGICPPKTESTDICFVSGKSYIDIISEHTSVPQAGKFIDVDGNVLGEHKGVHCYTVGQRKGLGIALGKPAFVSSINAEDNTVTLSVDTPLIKGFKVQKINFMAVPHVEIGERYFVRVRYRAKPVECYIENVSNNVVDVDFAVENPPVAPGQSAVFYDDNGVISFGGIIV